MFVCYLSLAVVLHELMLAARERGSQDRRYKKPCTRLGAARGWVQLEVPGGRREPVGAAAQRSSSLSPGELGRTIF